MQRLFAILFGLACCHGMVTSHVAGAERKKSTSPPPKAKPVATDRMVAETEYSPVPAEGSLSLQQLIDLALFNSMKSLAARGTLAVARAQRKAVTDWRDPELRLTYATQTDIETGSAFQESSTSNTYTTGTLTDRETQFGWETESGVTTSTSQTDESRLRVRESRFRTIERTVTPGATTDKIVTKQYEYTRTNTKGSNARTTTEKGSPKSERNTSNRQRNERLVSNTTTYVHHRNVTEPEEQFGILLRFPFPNPWEVKAKVAQAEADIRAADYQLKAVEDEIVLDVRSLYEEICYLEAVRRSQAKLTEQRKKFATLLRQHDPRKFIEASADGNQSRMDEIETTAKSRALRLKLANLVGLRDPGRISTSSPFRRRVVDLSKLDQSYLIQMASIYRSDIKLLHSKNEAAHAAYKAQRASRIPVATYVDAGYAYQQDYQGRNANEFTVRLGVSVPLWSWLFNKADRVPLEEARDFSRRIGRLQDNIEAEVASAIDHLKMIENEISNANQQDAALKVMLKTEAKNPAIMIDKHPEQIQNETEEILLRMDLNKLQLQRMYNQAVLQLEEALGTRLEKILSTDR